MIKFLLARMSSYSLKIGGIVGVLEDDWARVSEERSPESFKLSVGILYFFFSSPT